MIPASYRILHLPDVDSTNAEAMRRAADGENGPLWILADQQTAGRGRSGRNWASVPGNLHATLLVTLASAAAPKAYQLSLVAGVAVREALSDLLTPPPAALRLKWPNDLMIGREKTGGILIESSLARGALVAVIGIGVNLASHPEDLGRPVTHIGAHGKAPTPAALLAALTPALDRWLQIWQGGAGFPTVREAWLAGAHPIGERLEVSAGPTVIQGAFSGLDPDGALLLSDDRGEVRTFTYGDVTLAQRE